ncbi:MAG: hypothetical protein HQK58_10700 [Deltaproteobacteria bacterium]|nr:hypothetical protein [Deltaproteobacteria bacterium]
MAKCYACKEMLEFLGVDEEFLAELAEEGLLPGPGKGVGDVFTRPEIEEIRVMTTLVKEMGVNLAGVEVIIHLRRQVLDLRIQFDKILEYVSDEVKKEFSHPGD